MVEQPPVERLVGGSENLKSCELKALSETRTTLVPKIMPAEIPVQTDFPFLDLPVLEPAGGGGARAVCRGWMDGGGLPSRDYENNLLRLALA